MGGRQHNTSSHGLPYGLFRSPNSCLSPDGRELISEFFITETFQQETNEHLFNEIFPGHWVGIVRQFYETEEVALCPFEIIFMFRLDFRSSHRLFVRSQHGLSY